MNYIVKHDHASTELINSMFIKPFIIQITISWIWTLFFLVNVFTCIILPICPFRVIDNSLTFGLLFSIWCMQQIKWDKMRSFFIYLLNLYDVFHLASHPGKSIRYSIQRRSQKSLQVKSVGTALIKFYQFLWTIMFYRTFLIWEVP